MAESGLRTPEGGWALVETFVGGEAPQETLKDLSMTMKGLVPPVPTIDHQAEDRDRGNIGRGAEGRTFSLSEFVMPHGVRRTLVRHTSAEISAENPRAMTVYEEFILEDILGKITTQYDRLEYQIDDSGDDDLSVDGGIENSYRLGVGELMMMNSEDEKGCVRLNYTGCINDARALTMSFYLEQLTEELSLDRKSRNGNGSGGHANV